MKNCNKVKTVSKAKESELDEILKIKVNPNKIEMIFLKNQKLPSNLQTQCHPKINTLQAFIY